MKDSWIKSILNQDQFQAVDKWIYTFIQSSGEPNPLKDLDYCVLARKLYGLEREVIFSPNCFQQLSQVQSEFRAFNTMLISKPELSEVNNDERPLIFWFGSVYYFLKIFPQEV